MANREAFLSKRSRETLKRGERARQGLRETFERVGQELRRQQDAARRREGAVDVGEVRKGGMEATSVDAARTTRRSRDSAALS
jgi:hypothetical protein